MLSKLAMLRVSRLITPSVRCLGGMTPLEKFEKLCQLCCSSKTANKQEEEFKKVRPKATEDPSCLKSCDECCEESKMEYLDIRCKNAMVIGGGAGIGFETADNLLKSGVKMVIVADVNQEIGAEAVKKLCAAYGNNRAIFLATDVVQPLSIQQAFEEIYKRFTQLDIYVNTFGIYNETPQCWDNMIRVNLIGCIRGTLLAIKYMSGNPVDECCQGSVVLNVSSYNSVADVPSMPLYSAASNGIMGLTSSFGQDFHYSKTKVRCVTVCPACTDSDLLKNMSKKHYDPQWAGFSNSAMKCCSKQSVKIVGKAIVHALKFGPNGSVFVVKEGKFYKCLIPDYEKIMREEAVLL